MFAVLAIFPPIRKIFSREKKKNYRKDFSSKNLLQSKYPLT